MSDATIQAGPAPVAVGSWSHLLHPVFPRCVDPHAIRYDLSRPFVVGEYVYATNAQIALRMPTPEGWTLENAEKTPARFLPEMFEGETYWGDRWRREPTHFPPVEGTCKACLGAKVLPEVACPWCRAESPGPYEAGFCDECRNTEGRRPPGPCHECDGTGLLDIFGRLEVAPGYDLQRRYVALLHEFEMTTYLPAELAEGRTTRFTLGDITGLLMPMNRPDPGRRTP